MIAHLVQFDPAHENDRFRAPQAVAQKNPREALFKMNDFPVALVSMEAAARMDEHHADGTSSVQVLKDAIRYKTHGQTYDLQAGSLLTFGALIKHGVEPVVESGFRLNISWPDNQELLAMPHRGYGTQSF